MAAMCCGNADPFEAVGTTQGRRRDLYEDFALPDKTEVIARPFLDRIVARLEITDFGLQAGIARLELGIEIALGEQLLIELPHRGPASPCPPTKLQAGKQNCEDPMWATSWIDASGRAIQQVISAGFYSNINTKGPHHDSVTHTSGVIPVESPDQRLRRL